MKTINKLPSTQYGILPDNTKSAQIVADSPSRAHDNSTSELERRLDDALKETFPASDPVAVMICRRS